MSAPSIDELLEACTQDCMVADGPLAERLARMADEIRRLSPQAIALVDQLVNRLRASDAGAGAPAVGQPMPQFVLPDDNGHLVSLARLLESGPVAVSFHRGHWCPYCRISASALARIEPEVRAAGGQLVVITPETQAESRKLKAGSGATFPFLTDLDNGYALELQLAIAINQTPTVRAPDGSFVSQPGNGNWILPIPATFVVGQDGLVKGRFVDPDYRKRMGIEELLAAFR